MEVLYDLTHHVSAVAHSMKRPSDLTLDLRLTAHHLLAFTSLISYMYSEHALYHIYP